MLSLPGLTDISGAPNFGGAGGSAAPSSAGGTQGTSSPFNSSGWTVNMGSGSATGAPVSHSPMMIAGIVVAGLIAWKMFLRK